MTFFRDRYRLLNTLPLSPQDQAFLALFIDTCFLLLKQFLRLEAVIDRLRPQAVMACMDKDSFGIMLQELRKKQPLKLLNYQHGIMTAKSSLQLFHFDAFMVWNRLTHDMVLQGAYGHPDTIYTVGNPLWRPLDIRDPANQAQPERVREILDWKGSDRLVVAYTQGLRIKDKG